MRRRRAAASVHVTDDEGYAALGGDEQRVVNKERLRVNGATHYRLRDITGKHDIGVETHHRYEVELQIQHVRSAWHRRQQHTSDALRARRDDQQNDADNAVCDDNDESRCMNVL